MFLDYHRQYQVDIRVARIFNTYGPRMHPNDGRVVSNFIIQALKNENITIYGSGQQTRSFCYVDDLVEGFIRYMELPKDAPDLPLVLNLGNPSEFTIRELAEVIIDLTGSSSKLVYLPLPSDDPQQRKPDIQLALKNLDSWRPKTELRVGLTSTISYFEKILHHERSY